MKFYFQHKIKNGAFTLIELLVSISILGIIAAISVSSYPKFSEQMGVGTEASKVLAYMREAQVYGNAGYTEPGVKVVYGVEIDRDTNILRKIQWQNPNSSTNQSYVSNAADTGEANLTIGDRFEIERMCNINAGISSCDNNGNYDKVYLFFRRPNPETRLIGKVGTIMYPDQNSQNGLQKIEVHIRSKKNQQFVKKIVILQTGQMYVE